MDEELIEKTKRGRIKMKPNLMLYFNDPDFADCKPLAKNEMSYVKPTTLSC